MAKRTRQTTQQQDPDPSACPAVGYVRCSTDAQTEASIPAQKDAIERYARQHGYSIARWYADEGISGWRDDREAFGRLIADLDRRDFRAVLCWDQNRFSRFPPLEANFYWFQLDQAGVHLATVGQGRLDWSSLGGWLTASIKAHADSEHRFQLSRDVRRGKRAVAMRGDWAGRPPLGYHVDPATRRLVLGDPEAVALIQRIFADFVSGHSLRSIAHKLNDEGLHRLNEGRLFGPQSIRAKLSNPAYVGDFVFRDIRMDDHHPAIVDRATFEAVQELLTARQGRTTPVRDGGPFLFTSLVHCGKCGGKMSGTNPRNTVAYKCNAAARNGRRKCEGNWISQAELFEAAIEAIQDHWDHPATIQALRREMRSQLETDRPKLDARKLERQRAKVAERITKAKQRMIEVDREFLDVVQEGLRDLREQHDRLTVAIEAARTPLEEQFGVVDERIEAAVQAFARMREVLAAAPVAEQRELLRLAIVKIDVWTTKTGKGNRTRYSFQKGDIGLRVDNLSGRSGWPCRNSSGFRHSSA